MNDFPRCKQCEELTRKVSHWRNEEERYRDLVERGDFQAKSFLKDAINYRRKMAREQLEHIMATHQPELPF